MAVTRLAARLAAVLVLAWAGLAVAGAADAMVPTGVCPAWDGVQPQVPEQAGLSGVAVLRPCTVWAGGQISGGNDYPFGATMILRLDGSTWAQRPTPIPGTVSSVTAVTALSARAAWATVNYTPSASLRRVQTGHILIERWTGSSWVSQHIPQPGGKTGYTTLFGVAATSAHDVWAVGSYATATVPDTPHRTLILHWNGSRWKQVPSPDPSGRSLDNRLTSVTVISPANAWAAGYYQNARHTRQPLVLHWNGQSWRQAPLPSVGRSLGAFLFGVTATSARNAWAVGYVIKPSPTTQELETTLVLHWNGHRWSRQRTPNPLPAAVNQLQGVAGTSARNVWAVGFSGSNAGAGPHVGLILHWNGHHWHQVPCPDPGTGNNDETLHGIATSSVGSAWAVGSYNGDNTDGGQALILHWNGHNWQD